MELIYQEIGLELLSLGSDSANLFFKKAFYSGEKWKFFLKNDLYNYFQANKSYLRLHKWIHYFKVYDRFFAPFRNKEIKFLEIGVFGGGSLAMWKNYFGAKAKICGIDINPECKQYESEGISIYIGDQADRDFLENVAENEVNFDLILDDGGHTMNQQIVSLETLFKYLKKGGIYMVEDCHTSYWPAYGGGLKNPNSFIEYSKVLIDRLNQYHNGMFREPMEQPIKALVSISFFDSIVVFEKDESFPSFHEIMGSQHP